MYTQDNVSMRQIGMQYETDGKAIKNVLIKYGVDINSKHTKKNNYIIDGNIVRIELRRRNKESLWALIDLEDLDRVINFPYSWHSTISTTNKKIYAMASQYNKHASIQLQMFIMNLDGGHEAVADHINHNQLDNRKSNLRVITNGENSRSRKGKNINNISGYRNVAYIKYAKHPYRVQLMVDGKNSVLGNFDDPHEAGAFAESMRQKYYGKYKGLS